MIPRGFILASIVAAAIAQGAGGGMQPASTARDMSPAGILSRTVRIPGGTFTMGSDTGDEDARPAHRVTLGDFAIGICEVTNDEYATFVTATKRAAPSSRSLPSVIGPDRAAMFRSFAAAYEWRDGTYPAGKGLHPVVMVRHEDAQAFCAWLSQATGKHVSLPTEAEWEYAARGGREELRYPWGDTLALTQANYLASEAVKTTSGTKPVGQYPANGYGLRDVAGNAWEWVADFYDAKFYENAPATNPTGPASGIMRIVRGGAWVDTDVALIEVSHRHEVPLDTFSYSIGFRVVVH